MKGSCPGPGHHQMSSRHWGWQLPHFGALQAAGHAAGVLGGSSAQGGWPVGAAPSPRQI